ncbi:MAG: hypothetical protein ACRCYY_11045 [Trueperaceae bacterium]
MARLVSEKIEPQKIEPSGKTLFKSVGLGLEDLAIAKLLVVAKLLV